LALGTFLWRTFVEG